MKRIVTTLIAAGPIFCCCSLLARAPAKSTPGPTPAAVNSADPGWPREFKDGTAVVTAYQPQIEDWKDNRLITARIALTVIRAAGEKPIPGALSIEAETVIDQERREVIFETLKITNASFPSVSGADLQQMQALVNRVLPPKPMPISIELLSEAVELSKLRKTEVRVNLDPPPIYVRTGKAILVIIDGEPIMADIESSGLTYVLNTNWDLLQDKATARYYLLNEQYWLTAATLNGPWAAASSLPQGFSKLPEDENWKDVKAQLPAKAAATPPPEVIIASKPSELILLDGAPLLEAITGTALMTVVNTHSDLFYNSADRHYYYLTSGRWFRAYSLDGPWQAATLELPADFSNIPVNHPRAHVLISVPGTPQAEEAVLAASVPTIATVDRNAVKASVNYVGAPQFKPIEGTQLQYAVNTPADVIKHDDGYYLVQQGVWFTSASSNGPWMVAASVPEQIYKIPPESAKHNVTYVHVYNSTPTVVTCGYTAGYTGVMVSTGLVFWGSGWYYPPYYHYGRYPYPIYWPSPYYTYGTGAWYNPASGTYWRGAVAYGPYGGYGHSAAYNPVTGAYGRRTAAWGPYEGAVTGSFYNPTTGAWGSGYRYANAYQGWGQGVTQKGREWARGGYYYDDRGTVGGIRTSSGTGFIGAAGDNKQGFIGRGQQSDIYAGKNGDVYKRDANGGWYKGQNGSWSEVRPPSSQYPQRQTNRSARLKPGALPANTKQSLRTALPVDRVRNTSAEGLISAGSGTFNRDAVRDLNRQAQVRQSGAERQHRSQDWQRSHPEWSQGSRTTSGRASAARARRP